jgi:hypothetical protein
MDTKAQPTIWEIPDNVWSLIELILSECYPPKPKGYCRADLRLLPVEEADGLGDRCGPQEPRIAGAFVCGRARAVRHVADLPERLFRRQRVVDRLPMPHTIPVLSPCVQGEDAPITGSLRSPSQT